MVLRKFVKARVGFLRISLIDLDRCPIKIKFEVKSKVSIVGSEGNIQNISSTNRLKICWDYMIAANKIDSSRILYEKSYDEEKREKVDWLGVLPVSKSIQWAGRINERIFVLKYCNSCIYKRLIRRWGSLGSESKKWKQESYLRAGNKTESNKKREFDRHNKIIKLFFVILECLPKISYCLFLIEIGNYYYYFRKKKNNNTNLELKNEQSVNRINKIWDFLSTAWALKLLPTPCFQTVWMEKMPTRRFVQFFFRVCFKSFYTNRTLLFLY